MSESLVVVNVIHFQLYYLSQKKMKLSNLQEQTTNIRTWDSAVDIVTRLQAG